MYMAPEIVKRGSYTTKCDIWSFGVLVFQMVVGRYPFGESGDNIDSHNHLLNLGTGKTRITWPEGGSVMFRDFVQRCFRDNPEERPGCSELIEHPFLTGMEITVDSTPGKDTWDMRTGKQGEETPCTFSSAPVSQPGKASGRLAGF